MIIAPWGWAILVLFALIGLALFFAWFLTVGERFQNLKKDE